MDSDERERLTGRLVLNFGQLETLVALTIWKLLGIDGEVGWAVTGGRSFRQLLDLLREAGRKHVAEAATEELLKELLTKADLARRKRNEVLHAGWFTTEDFAEDVPPNSIAVVRLGKLRGDSFPWPPDLLRRDDLAEAVDATSEAVAAVLAFIKVLAPEGLEIRVPRHRKRGTL